MTSFLIMPPYTVWPDVDGEPLEDGYIYIGAAGLNPETNPISVFFDANLTIPAAQPLRTIGGFISNSGSPANVFTSLLKASITVRNKNGTLVYTNLNAVISEVFGTFYEVDSVQALLDSSIDTTVNVVNIASFYAVTWPSLVGGKGRHKVHRTGATAGAPSVGAPVTPGTQGTADQAGYYWDQLGAEWKICDDQELNAWMFGTTGVEADTGYSQELQNFFLYTLSRPGRYTVPPGVYMIEQTIGGTKTGEGWHYYECAGAVFKRIDTLVAYNMFSCTGEYIHIFGLGLYGYVDSGSTHADVVPPNSYGFRFDGGSPQRHIIFENCYADNIPYDGWLLARNCEDIQLLNCEGGQNEECYRNTVAIAPSGAGAYADQISIRGGRFAKARVRPAIDIEPDTSGDVGYVFVGDNVRCTGVLVAEPSRVDHLHIDGVILDGADSGCHFEGVRKITIGDLDFINGAELTGSWGPADQFGSPSALAERVESRIRVQGNITGLGNNNNSKNLLEYSYNTPQFDTTPSSSGPGTATATYNTLVGPDKGVEIDCDLRSYLLSRDYTIEPETIYSFGAFTQMISGANNSHHIMVTERDGGGVITNSWVFEPNTDSRHHNLIWKTQATAATLRVQIGQNSTSFTGICRYGGFYLYKGILTDGWRPHTKERFGPMYTVAPTNGTWEVGETVSIVTPAAGSVGQVCTVAGTPGTWAAF